jgi:hypothetical protein
VWQRLRTIIEDAAAQEAADLFSEQFDRFDKAWEGLKWLLSRKPEIGYPQTINGVPTGYRLHIQAADELARTPEIWVVYTHDDNEVVIHEINAVTPPDEDEEKAKPAPAA